MLAALSQARMIDPVRNFGHGPIRLRALHATPDILQVFNKAHGQRATINGAGDFTNPQGIASSEIFGAGASVGTNSTSVVIGNGASVAGTNSGQTIIGASAAGGSTQPNQTGVGASCTVSGASASAFGKSATAGATYALALGVSTNASFDYSIAMGGTAATTATNQLVIGGTSATITDSYIGNGVTNASPVATAINATGGTGANVSGAALTIAGGICTGNATGGQIAFKTSPTGTAGSSQNALVTRMVINYDGGVHVAMTATPGPASLSGYLRIGASTSGSIAIGYNSTLVAGNGEATVIGNAATGDSNGTCTAIGANANAGRAAVALGRSANSSAGRCSIAIGTSATTTANNQLVIGASIDADGNAASITDSYIGNGVTHASPASTAINATGGSGTNIAGANLTLAAGKGTGSGVGGVVKIQTSTAGGSGTTLQTLATVAEFGVAKIGFFGVTAVARASAYTPTNVSADRSYDANSTTIDEIADVLGSLIADLQAYGLLQ